MQNSEESSCLSLDERHNHATRTLTFVVGAEARNHCKVQFLGPDFDSSTDATGFTLRGSFGTGR